MALLLGPGDCTGAATGELETRTSVQRIFDRRAEAVLAADPARYLETVDPGPGPGTPAHRDRQRRVTANLARLPVASWAYDVQHVTVQGHEAVATVALRYRLDPGARSPVTERERFRLLRRDGRWYVAGELPDSARQVWEQGRMRVVRGEHSLVLGAVGRAELRRIAGRADTAVAAATRAWPEARPLRTVVLVPASLRDMAELLDGDVATYTGIAAVTTGPPEGEPGEWRRVVVNRQAYARLSDRGRQVVITHETAHVATRAHTRPSTPLWLSEGMADWIAYRGTGTEPVAAAPTLAADVRDGELPRRLPRDAHFGFDGGSHALGTAYEGSWLACRMIADRWGAAGLAEFYVAVGEAEVSQNAAVDRALEDVLGTDREEFIRMWRLYLRAQLR